jgi:hypothetical protein
MMAKYSCWCFSHGVSLGVFLPRVWFRVCWIRVHGTVYVAYFSYDKSWDIVHALHLCNYSWPSRTTPTVVKLVGYNRKLSEKYSGRTLGHVSD